MFVVQNINIENMIDFLKKDITAFMTDSTDSSMSKGSEAVMDYIMSWALRNVVNKDVEKKSPNLHHQCKYMLCKLLEKEHFNDYNVDIVKVWKEWENIDLFVEVELHNKDGNNERHIIVIENKVYSTMKPNQRDEYPKKVVEWKDQDDDWKDAKTHYCVVTCCTPSDSSYENLKTFCSGTDWRVLSSEEIVDWYVNTYTESKLFNDFWFRHW